FGGPGTGCSSEAEFEVLELIPDPILINCPVNAEIVACLSQTAINQELSNWFAQFTYSGGLGDLDVVYKVDGQVININTYTLPTFTPCTGGSITVTLTVTDECEQEASCSATFSVAGDDEAPTASNPAPITVACVDDIPVPNIAVVIDAADNCGAPIVTHEGDVSDNDLCEPTITRTYKVADACGNFVYVTQTINI